jgi:hypothetical protein
VHLLSHRDRNPFPVIITEQEKIKLFPLIIRKKEASKRESIERAIMKATSERAKAEVSGEKSAGKEEKIMVIMLAKKNLLLQIHVLIFKHRAATGGERRGESRVIYVFIIHFVHVARSQIGQVHNGEHLTGWLLDHNL